MAAHTQRMKVLITEPKQETMLMSSTTSSTCELMSETDSDHAEHICRLFVDENQRRSPSPEPHQEYAIQEVSNDGKTKTIRLFYNTDLYFKGTQTENDEYIISEIHEPYNAKLDIKVNEWIIVDINYHDFDVNNNYNYLNIRRQLNVCNAQFCFPSRSTGYIIKIKRIRHTSHTDINLYSTSRTKYSELHGNWGSLPLQNANHGTYYYSISDLNIKHIRKRNTIIIVTERSLRATQTKVVITDKDRYKTHPMTHGPLQSGYTDHSVLHQTKQVMMSTSNHAKYKQLLQRKEDKLQTLQSVIVDTKHVIRAISEQLQTAQSKIETMEKENKQLREDNVAMNEQYGVYSPLETNPFHLRNELEITKREMDELQLNVNEEKSLWKSQEMMMFEAQCASMNDSHNMEIQKIKSDKDLQIGTLKEEIKELLVEYVEFKGGDLLMSNCPTSDCTHITKTNAGVKQVRCSQCGNTYPL